MRALLDTNIVIHREMNKIKNRDIGVLFKWLDKAKYTKCVHPITIHEIEKNSNKETVDTFSIKLQSYETLKTTAPLSPEIASKTSGIDNNDNDRNDTIILNEVFCDRVDLLITEDKKIHQKANLIGIADRVFSIDAFLEKIVSENPDLINYKILSVTKKHFGDIDINDMFFDSFREDYQGFNKWFNKKSDETAYVTFNKQNILSFLYLKVEDSSENYSDITPSFSPKKRLKVGTLKVVSNGVRLGERFLKIIFDNAIQYKVDEIYVTIFDKRDEQKRLIELLLEWGFIFHGYKKTENGQELVYTRNFSPNFLATEPKKTYPFISKNQSVFLNPIYPAYHTELLPDSILNNESPYNFIENEPHRNAISKVYISRSIERNLKSGDIIIFYRTGGYYKSVITTLGIVESLIFDIENEHDFIIKCRKRSVFTDDKLREFWNYNKGNRPFIVNFLYTYSFPKRINMEKLIQLGIIKDVGSAPRGFAQISKGQFETILKETQTDESIIVN